MNEPTIECIPFEVETNRILQILSAEIYDSPKAFLRENVQNAYDAILMRCTAQNIPIENQCIRVTVSDGQLSVSDNGIGMSEEILINNFWKAGASGKKSELAQRSGVIGTFGIGAMANFGVCTALRVESRSLDSSVTLITSVERSKLRIAHDCINLERNADDRGPGTIIRADLDSAFSINETEASAYLKQFVRFLPVPVLVNDTNISQERFEDTLDNQKAGFEMISSRPINNDRLAGKLSTFANTQGQVLVRITDLALNENALNGEIFLVQKSGQILGYRNSFGLAPIPITSIYDFSGFINFNILTPTAGREALSRESIQLVSDFISLIELEASKDLAQTAWADRNLQFQQYILSKRLISLAQNISITVLPGESRRIPLGNTKNYEPEKTKHFYAGKDTTIQQRFSNETANLFQVSQSHPRRNLQLFFLREIATIQEVPEHVVVERIPNNQLTLEEAIFLGRLRGVLLDDYFIINVNASFAEISHGVSLHIEEKESELRISLAREMPAVKVVLQTFRSAPEVFHGFLIDLVRQHVYPKIRDQVPSSTKLGKDALYLRIKQNEELFKYDFDEVGEIETLMSDFISGKASLEQFVKTYSGHMSGHRQEVRKEQVGDVENEIPDILNSEINFHSDNAPDSSLPILRPELISEMKILTVRSMHPKLNNFQMFLSLTERLAQREGDFLRQPHKTKLMWGSHRVIYIFAYNEGELNLYYDLKLKEPLETDKTGGAMIPTTTIVTKNRIFVPVPKELESAFRISRGSKEFFVRFDTIP